MNAEVMYVTKRSSNTLRVLTEEEIALVSGGSDTITVTGSRYDYSYYDYWSYSNFFYDYSYYDQGGGGGGGGGGEEAPPADEGELTEGQEEVIKEGMNSLKATLEAYVQKYGDFELKLADGSTYKASDLIRGADALSKAFDVLEGAQLTAAIVNGNADIGAVIGFVAGLAGSAAVGAAGAGPLAAFAAGLAIGYGAEVGYNAITGLIDQSITNYANAMQQANPGWNDLPSSIQEYIFLQQLFGIPPNPYDDGYGGGGGGGGGYGGGGGGGYDNPHYNIP